MVPLYHKFHRFAYLIVIFLSLSRIFKIGPKTQQRHYIIYCPIKVNSPFINYSPSFKHANFGILVPKSYPKLVLLLYRLASLRDDKFSYSYEIWRKRKVPRESMHPLQLQWLPRYFRNFSPLCFAEEIQFIGRTDAMTR